MDVNYRAFVAEITETKEIPGADFIHSAKVLGEWVITDKPKVEGTLGILIPVGCKVSTEFAYENNLFSSSDLNKNPESKGYLSSNGRIVAVNLRKTPSQGLFLPLESIAYTGFDVSVLKVGDAFNKVTVGKKEFDICSKYIKPTSTKVSSSGQPKSKKVKHSVPFFKEHTETSQFKYCAGQIQRGSLLSFTAKTHGTSGRQSYTLADKVLKPWQKLFNRIFPIFPHKEWRHVIGTRRTVMNADVTDKGYYGNDKFRVDVAERIKPHLTKGMSAYYEILGYTTEGQRIMPLHSVESLKDKKYTKKYGKEVGYSYGCMERQTRVQIYRITVTTEDGLCYDYTYPQLVSWCERAGLEPVLEIHPPFVYDGDEESLRKLVDELTERPDVLTEDYISPNQISEGIIIREDRGALEPKLYKSKSQPFRIMEGIESVTNMEEEN